MKHERARQGTKSEIDYSGHEVRGRQAPRGGVSSSFIERIPSPNSPGERNEVSLLFKGRNEEARVKRGETQLSSYTAQMKGVEPGVEPEGLYKTYTFEIRVKHKFNTF